MNVPRVVSNPILVRQVGDSLASDTSQCLETSHDRGGDQPSFLLGPDILGELVANWANYLFVNLYLG